MNSYSFKMPKMQFVRLIRIILIIMTKFDGTELQGCSMRTWLFTCAEMTWFGHFFMIYGTSISETTYIKEGRLVKTGAEVQQK